MAGLLYFRPGTTAPVLMDEVERLGLEHAFDRVPTSRVQVGRGPSGTSGTVFADAARMGRASIGYYPDQQEWEPVPVEEGDPRLWIGWYRDLRPTPEDLARTEQLYGSRVRLADDQQWVVPKVRDWTDEGAICTLPQVMRRVANGGWVFAQVMPMYEAIWDAANRFISALVATVAAAEPGQTEGDYEFPGLYDFAAELLGLNYAIGPLEVSALGLFAGSPGDTLAHEVGIAAVSWRNYNAWATQKKTAQTGATTSAGNAA